MANLIPEGKISEIKHTADIVDVVSEVVVLKKAGRNFIGLCPFHTEKTPSFTVSPDKQIFHCFGCGQGGSVFNFVMQNEGLSFPEAVRTLARRYGIEIPAPDLSPQQRKTYAERDRLLEIHHQAQAFFREALAQDPAQKGLRYLQKRGFSQKTIADFGLGYAPNEWDRLTRYLRAHKFSQSLAEKAGLVLRRKNSSGCYDRFRDRVIFPIFSLSGAVIAFGGRVFDDQVPKYLNSPETPLFHKGETLYGLNRAKQSCRQQEAVIIVEGYFDLLALHQHGITHSVATLGTALTPEQVQRLRGFVGQNGKAVLVFDSDAAGIKAAQRSIAVFGKSYVDARILILPQGDDPDSFIFKHGADPFRRAVKEAPAIFPFLIESAVQRHGLSIEGKIRIVDEIIEPLVRISDAMERALYVKALAERVGVDEQPLLEKLQAAIAARKDLRYGQREAPPSARRAVSPQGESHPKPATGFGENRLERQIVAMMLQFPKILPEIKKRDLMRLFEDPRLKAIGEMVLRQEYDSTRHLSGLLNAETDEEKRRLISSLAMQEDLWEYEGCLKLISQFEYSRSRRKPTLLAQIKAAEARNDQELLMKLLQEKQEQTTRIKS